MESTEATINMDVSGPVPAPAWRLVGKWFYGDRQEPILQYGPDPDESAQPGTDCANAAEHATMSNETYAHLLLHTLGNILLAMEATIGVNPVYGDYARDYGYVERQLGELGFTREELNWYIEVVLENDEPITHNWYTPSPTD